MVTMRFMTSSYILIRLLYIVLKKSASIICENLLPSGGMQFIREISAAEEELVFTVSFCFVEAVVGSFYKG